ncbi:ArgS-related anticodon-binding protein NrtL [Streptomyces phaeochromogenes]|uniref:ArgS-related anticodon-binding protein NrtL n=1 Tax=Streptomyces phaeochromogenes TaxID=1923 RepID=UPI002DD7E239|nr:DALR anticodon-binding domain-containing protein [Streptomyces phaeochromogenes]WRZ29372.1 DALR anticodon-binding domain-containing protein [Streptomyces phaeochromogenes]
MTPVELSRTVLRAVRRAVDAGEFVAPVPEWAQVAPPGPGGRGDYATNVALQLARPAGRPPQEVARILRSHLADAEGVAGVDITGPGFLNITLDGSGAQALVAEVLRRGARYGVVDEPTGELVQLHHPREVRAAVTAHAVARILRSQGALVRTSCEDEPDPAWAAVLGVSVDAHGTQAAPAPLKVNVRPVPAGQDPTPLGRDAARWALLHPASHDRPRITSDHLLQGETNPLFRVRYAHARTRALSGNAAALGFSSAAGDVQGNATHTVDARTRALTRNAATLGLTSAPGDVQDNDATHLVDALAAYPHVLATAARHRAPDRLARHLVTTADAVLVFQHTVLPLGDEKPSAAHRARLALAEAAGAVLAGGLSLLGIDAPEHL